MRVDAHDRTVGPASRRAPWVSRLPEQVSRYLAGDDVFISYSRADGVLYAQALAAALTEHGFTCRIDLYDTDTSVEIPSRLKSVIRRAYLLLVVGSPAACQSRFVSLEIGEFAATGRNFVVIGFGAEVANACWFDAVAGRVVQEQPRALHTGQASRAIVTLAEQSFRFQKKNRRLRRTALVTACSISAMLLIGAGGGVLLQRDIDKKQAELANTQGALTQTRGILGRAEHELTSAQGRLGEVQGQLIRTEEQRARAAAAADLQEMIARARKDAADAVGVRNQLGYTPVPEAVAAVGAARSLAALGLPAEADAALRGLRPTLSALVTDPPPPDLPPEPVNGAVVSRDGSLVAGQTRAREDTIVWRRGARDVWRRFPCGEPSTFVDLAFSADGNNLAQSCAGKFSVFDLESGRRRKGFDVGWTRQVVFGPSHLFVVEQGNVEQFAAFDLSSGARISAQPPERAPARMLISPDGRFVTTSCRWYEGEPPADCLLRMYELPKFTLVISQRIPDESVQVFSDDSAYLAVRVAGIMRVWESATRLLVSTFTVPGDGSFHFGRNPSRLYVSTSADARVLDTFSGETLALFPGGRSIADDPRVPGAVSVAGTKFAETWRIQPLDKTAFLESQGRASRLLFDDTGRYFSLCTSEGQEPTWRISLWEVSTTRRLSEAVAGGCASAFQSGARAFAFQAENDSVVVLSLPDIKPTRIPWQGTLESLAFDAALGWIGTPFGQPRHTVTLATAQSIGDALSEGPGENVARQAGRALWRDQAVRTLRLLDRQTGKTFFESDFPARLSAWNQDATLILGASTQEMRVWKASSKEVLLRRFVPADVSGFAFAPDNRTLLMSWGRAKTRLGLYSWRLDDMFKETCTILRSNRQSRFDAMRPDRRALAETCPVQVQTNPVIKIDATGAADPVARPPAPSDGRGTHPIPRRR